MLDGGGRNCSFLLEGMGKDTLWEPDSLSSQADIIYGCVFLLWRIGLREMGRARIKRRGGEN